MSTPQLVRANQDRPFLQMNWINRLLIMGIFLLPIMVLIRRVPAELSVGLTVLIALFVAFRHRDFSWMLKDWVLASGGVSLVLLFLSPFSVNPAYSALSAILAFRWPIYAAALVWLFFSMPRSLKLFERVMLFVIGFIVVDTFIQYIFGVDLFGGTSPNPTRLTGPFGVHMLVGSFIDRVWFIGLAVVWFALIKRNQVWALIAIAALSAVGALFMFLTGERAALLTYLLGAGVVVIGVLIYVPRWRLQLMGLIMLAMLLIVGVAVTQKEMVGRSIDSTISTIHHLDQNVYGLNFMTAWAEFKANPWTGVGARQFKEYCDSTMPTYSEKYTSMGYQGAVLHPHNFYTGMLAEGGILAFSVFVVMVFFLFKQVIRGSFIIGAPMHAYFGSALLLTTFWPAQSTMEYFNGWTAAVIWTGIAWAIARSRVSALSN
ncbi:MAG: O-antigen ligase family protein [Halothiobacillus sp.]